MTLKKEAFLGALAKGMFNTAKTVGKAYGKSAVEAGIMPTLMVGSMIPGIRSAQDIGIGTALSPFIGKGGAEVANMFINPLSPRSLAGFVAHSSPKSMGAMSIGEASRKIVGRHPSMKKPMFKTSGVKNMNKLAMAAKKRWELEKTGSRSSFMNAAKDLGPLAQQLLAYGTLGVGMGVGAPLAAYGIGKGIKRMGKATIGRDYKKMIKEDPDLKDDPNAMKNYKVLHSISPYIAREPAVAAKVIRNMSELPEITPATYNEILKLEKSLQDTSMPFLRPQGGGKGYALPMKDLASMAGE